MRSVKCTASCTDAETALSLSHMRVWQRILSLLFKPANPLDSKGNYSATSNNRKLVWPLMGGLLHLVQRGWAWAGCGPAQSPHRWTKCNSPPINGQCTNHCIAIFHTCFIPVGLTDQIMLARDHRINPWKGPSLCSLLFPNVVWRRWCHLLG